MLACPICREYPLTVSVFEEYKIKNILPNQRSCEDFCGYLKKPLSKSSPPSPCEVCYCYEIKYGLLSCSKCNRWYPIIDEIPRILPDELRNKRNDIFFLKKWRKQINSDIIKNGKPFKLSKSEI